MNFLEPGCGEDVKLVVHGGLLLGAALACGYNTAAFVARGDRHLAINALVYFALALLEIQQVDHHCAR